VNGYQKAQQLGLTGEPAEIVAQLQLINTAAITPAQGGEVTGYAITIGGA